MRDRPVPGLGHRQEMAETTLHSPPHPLSVPLFLERGTRKGSVVRSEWRESEELFDYLNEVLSSGVPSSPWCWRIPIRIRKEGLSKVRSRLATTILISHSSTRKSLPYVKNWSCELGYCSAKLAISRVPWRPNRSAHFNLHACSIWIIMWNVSVLIMILFSLSNLKTFLG